jgi:hypothetical protein
MWRYKFSSLSLSLSLSQVLYDKLPISYLLRMFGVVDITTAKRPSQLFMFYPSTWIMYFFSFLLIPDRSLLNWGLFCVLVPYTGIGPVGV